MWLLVQAIEVYVIGIQKHIPKVNKCRDSDGDCVENYLKACVMSFSLDFVNKYLL